MSDEALDIFWERYRTETDSEIKLFTLNLLAKFDYTNAKDELLKVYAKKPIEVLKILHLYCPDRIKEWKDLIEKTKRESTDLELLEYIKYLIEDKLS